MIKRICLTLAVIIFAPFPDCFGIQPNVQLANSVVKIVARSAENKIQMGSGVVIAADKVVTNCHVTRAAQSISLLKSGYRFEVVAQAKIPELDTCVLLTQTLPLPTAPLADLKQISIGTDISIFGYPYALGIRGMAGTIINLHHYQGQKIIEIDSGFMQGASGGGVFNGKGELVGLMTFIGKEAKQFHFYAIPATWVASVLTEKFSPVASFSELSFWESGKFNYLALP